MRVEEAQDISTRVRALNLQAGTVCLNLGSSTKQFREIDQPHIHRLLIAPLEASGIIFVHCDMKSDEGVEMVGDVLAPEFQNRLVQRGAGLLLCCNILEHLTDPQAFATACANLVRPGGYAVVSVPLSYPYHPDPIDTMLRPTPEEIARLFPGWTIVHGAQVTSGSFWSELMAHRGGASRLLAHLARVLLPFYRPQNWVPMAHRLLWLFKPYKVSVVLLHKPA